MQSNVAESFKGELADIGDRVCLISQKTQMPISGEFEVIGIAYRGDTGSKAKKYLYLSDGNCAYSADEVRVVEKLLNIEEMSND